MLVPLYMLRVANSVNAVESFHPQLVVYQPGRWLTHFVGTIKFKPQQVTYSVTATRYPLKKDSEFPRWEDVGRPPMNYVDFSSEEEEEEDDEASAGGLEDELDGLDI